MNEIIISLILHFIKTRNLEYRGPLLILLNEEIDKAKAKNNLLFEVQLKAMRTILSKRKVQFEILMFVAKAFGADMTEYDLISSNSDWDQSLLPSPTGGKKIDEITYDTASTIINICCSKANPQKWTARYRCRQVSRLCPSDPCQH